MSPPGNYGGGGYGQQPYGGTPGGDDNLSFERPDGLLRPINWTVSAVDTWGEDAAFGQGVALPIDYGWEGFEGGWSNDGYAFTWDEVKGEGALYSGAFFAPPLSVENFEAGWVPPRITVGKEVAFRPPNWGPTPSPYLTTSADFLAAEYAHQSGPEPVEDFESEWGNDFYVFLWSQLSVIQEAIFANGTPFEDFETGWSNVPYATQLAQVGLQQALYDGLLASGVEDFESVKLDATCTVDHTTGIFTQVNNGLADAYRVQFYAGAGSVLPTGLDPTAIYWIQVSGDTFVIALTEAGTQVFPSDNGSGLMYLTEPFEFWTQLMTSV